MGNTHVYIIKPMAPTPRPKPSKLRNLHRNSAVGLPENGWHGFEQRTIDNATDEWCKHI